MNTHRLALQQTKQSATRLASVSADTKKSILSDIAKELKIRSSEIMNANKTDVENAQKSGKNAAFIDRLTITKTTIESMLQQLRIIEDSKDTLGETIEDRTLANGIQLRKVRVPIGVIAVIYESRPNVTIDVAALCIKSGNAAVLKGGSDAIHTNTVLIDCVHAALKKNDASPDTIAFIDSTDHKVTRWLIRQSSYIDLVIPRGGYELVNMVARHTRIPILYHGAGGARIYIDISADIQKAIDICINARTSRPATCNSADSILVHEKLVPVIAPQLAAALNKKGVQIRADKNICTIIDAQEATPADYKTEFLDLIVTMKSVSNVHDALRFITKYTKHHSEGIVSEDEETIQEFINGVDAAAVFVNCSTRFHDGGEFGLGAEMGIATGKLHARGPVGVQELTTYKWIARGTGQIRI